MLVRSLRIPPSLLLLVIFLFFFGWHLSQGPRHEQTDISQSIPQPQNEGGPPEKKAPRIALMTFVTEQRSYLYLSLKNKDHYARRHGYDFHMDYEAHADRGVMFWKFEMTERLVKSGRYDWIWWLDFDTLITNTDIKVTDVIEDELKNVTDPDEIDYLITHDCNGFNAGSFLVRGHERSLKFMHDAVDMFDAAKSKDVQISEQDAMVKLLKEDEATAARVHVMPQWQLNAFPKEISCYDEVSTAWQPGTFLLHFAGAWAHVKGEDPTGQLMKKYEDKIIWGDWRDFYNQL